MTVSPRRRKHFKIRQTVPLSQQLLLYVLLLVKHLINFAVSLWRWTARQPDNSWRSIGTRLHMKTDLSYFPSTNWMKMNSDKVTYKHRPLFTFGMPMNSTPRPLQAFSFPFSCLLAFAGKKIYLFNTKNINIFKSLYIYFTISRFIVHPSA